ncbi:helix-hairpin-helix domain-containing protein [Allorhizocola rhizosphaerae]|uniref:helix-hairpin-helix domain-containing protein n=1 Tax=Allorhizocola rhizosphaerae TaxID=1872709 RepID=UPI000E3DECDD|nr:helix-hairpin-helix domain-containing protein [Allorhizocola rhizosphaerae]
MAWFIGQSILMIAAAFLLGLLVGWIIWGRLSVGRRSATTAPVAAIPEPRTSPENSAPDDDTGERAKPVAPVAIAEGTELVVAPSTSPEPSAEPSTEPAAEPSAEPERVAAVAVAEPQPAAEPSAGPATELSAEPEPVAAVAVAEPEPSIEPAPVAAAVVAAKPPSKRKSRKAAAMPEDGVEPDDLERIEGIGPAMSRALIAAGIKTYGQLADAGEDALRDAIQAKGLKFAPSLVTWSRQARLLADGDEEGFAELTRRLVAGRDEGRE